MPLNLPLDVYPAYLAQDTDTASPRSPIPILYFHSFGQPYCANPACPCLRGKRSVAALLDLIAKGNLTLREAGPLIEETQEKRDI